MFGGPAALIAMAFLALHRTHIAFSIESRSYALLMLALTVALWAGWRWIEAGRRAHAITFVVAAAAALYTHYLAGVALGLAALAGLSLAGPRRRGWILLHVAVAVLFAPQVPVLAAQAARLGGDTWVPQPGFGNPITG
jgi:4-amino-4-deoxy-L-arabinose transferase-like glycosyltransferase